MHDMVVIKLNQTIRIDIRGLLIIGWEVVNIAIDIERVCSMHGEVFWLHHHMENFSEDCPFRGFIEGKL